MNLGRALSQGPRSGFRTAGPSWVFAAGPVGLSYDESRTASQSVGPSDCGPQTAGPCQVVTGGPGRAYSLHTAVPTGPFQGGQGQTFTRRAPPRFNSTSPDQALTRRPRARLPNGGPQPGLHTVKPVWALKRRAPAGPQPDPRPQSVGIGRASLQRAPAGHQYGGPSLASIRRLPDGPSGGGPQLGSQTAGPCQAVIRRAPAWPSNGWSQPVPTGPSIDSHWLDFHAADPRPG